jgi:hypothetical protein
MCSELLKINNESFKLALNHLKPLVFDRVVNVRVSAAKVISETFSAKCIDN